jgi:hypothetical protein
MSTIVGWTGHRPDIFDDPAAARATVDALVTVWTQLQGGGTAETIVLARAAGPPVREIVLPVAQMAHSPHGRGI